MWGGKGKKEEVGESEKTKEREFWCELSLVQRARERGRESQASGRILAKPSGTSPEEEREEHNFSLHVPNLSSSDCKDGDNLHHRYPKADLLLSKADVLPTATMTACNGAEG